MRERALEDRSAGAGEFLERFVRRDPELFHLVSAAPPWGCSPIPCWRSGTILQAEPAVKKAPLPQHAGLVALNLLRETSAANP